MDQQAKALSDIERTKELFEYEMTEVVRQLKGSFAGLNAERLGLDESGFEVPAVQVPAELPAVSAEPVRLQFDPAAVPQSVSAAAIPQVSVSAPAVSIPAVPQVTPAAIPAAEMTAKQIAVPEIPAIPGFRMPETAEQTVRVQMPQVPDAGKISASVPAAAPVSVPAVAVPEAVRVGFRAEQMQISGAVQAPAVSVPVPKPFVPCEVCVTVKNPVETEIPKVKSFQPVTLRTAGRVPAVDVPAELAIPPMPAEIGRVQVTADIPSVPDVPQFVPHEASAVRLTVPAVTLPDIPQAEILPVKMNAPKEIPVPACPDCTAELQSILETAVSEAG
ncbi:MAG: hypothetical protein II723_07885 [Oscillospiraceae bacterium]|nr:hypothetical protein [Oscillospiraceae bacterium]